ncbi:MAG: LON peptidase substrate-binding domain-containing protein, partial [Euzebyaceae bacterium]|nr:LON peptidase substrate-binding domain-containing protein [Euzebyaceae bacterium]
MPSLDSVTLPLLPLTGGVVVPGMVVTIVVDDDEIAAALDAAQDAGSRLLLVPRIDGRYARVGTVAAVEQVDRTPDGRRGMLVRGLARAVVGTGVPGAGRALWVAADTVAEPDQPSERSLELAREYKAVVEGILERRGAGRRLAAAIAEIAEPGALADTAVYSPDLTLQRKVEVLETLDTSERLDKVLGWARETLAELGFKERIQADVTASMERGQREYLLRQQLAAIRKELGEDGDGDVAEGYRAKIADRQLPADVRAAVEREIGRLERMSEQSPEHGWIRTWLDWLTELPWGERTMDRLDLPEARAILDADHTGLDEVKDRIVEQLAVRKLRGERAARREQAGGDEPRPDAGTHADISGGRRAGAGAILALVGPPGVGKTSL